MSKNDALDGMDAFTELLDRLEDRVEKLGVERGLRQRAESDLHEAQRNLTRATGEDALRRLSDERAEKLREKHNALFKDVAVLLATLGNIAPGVSTLETISALKPRVAQAVIDTDEIQF